MNIIFIVVDTLRYDYIGANGNNWIETPNIDRLASESWCFDRAFCASFPTIPYRTDVMKGRYGDPFHPWKPLRHDVQTLPWTLAEAGYATQLIHDTPHLVNGGHNFDWPFHAWTFVRGAEVDRDWLTDKVEWPNNWCRDPLYDCLGDEAAENAHVFTYARTNRNRKKPEDWNCAKLFSTASQFLKDNANRENFFLWIDCFDPHEPWDAPAEFMKKYDNAPGYDGRVDPRSLFRHRNDERLSDAAKERIKAQYPAKLTWMDHCFGQFLDTLESTGLAQNSAVIFTGDHGTNVGDRGSFGKGAPVREQEGHVPLFIRLPEGDTGRSNIIVQPQDFFATILSLAGENPPKEIEGYDILTPAREGKDGSREIALAGTTTERWKSGAPILFTAFNHEWVLEVAAKPENCRLSRLGSLEYVEKDYPNIVGEMQAAAFNEIERRGIGLALMAWLRSGGENQFPDNCRFWDGWPGPSGFYTYFSRIYTGT
ncbi:sulfatase [Candidatus Poribacteria bacterium]|nr:sulfatase [Candidatus Poribacteria bacterium]